MRLSALAVLFAACGSPPAPVASTPADPTGPSYDPSRDAIPIVDSHVHLAFDPVADQLAAHGVRAVVDLASPERTLGAKYPIRVIQSGPMLTHPNGYPLDAWGSDGYGVGCDSTACIDSTIARLQGEGARLIKIALDGDGLAPELAAYATLVAHKRRMKVAVHALSDASALAAGKFGADILAHTPVEALSRATIDAWRVQPALEWTAADRDKRARAVISTLAAFGGSPTAIENLRELRAAGVTVLYGTDLGNLRIDGPSSGEMALMKQAGLSDEDVQNAMTTVPWHFWGFDAMGPIPGKPAGGA